MSARHACTALAAVAMAGYTILASAQANPLAQSAPAAISHQAEAPAKPAGFEVDGTVNVPAYRLPPSEYLSAEAKALLPREGGDFGGRLEALVKSGHVPQMRTALASARMKNVEKLRQKYGVEIGNVVIAGVQGTWVRPKSGTQKVRPILINLPGGGFIFADSQTGGMNESIPLAAIGDFDILSLTYSQAPESKFPAASIDVAKVYRELLKTHKPSQIGIFGNSAGGLLTAQALAWIQHEGLPTPAAAGIFCASADARWGGDAWHWQMPVGGSTSPPTLDERFYYGNFNLDDPLMSPIRSDVVLRRFPPTLLLTSTRAGEMSASVNTHRLLVRNGVEADLHVWDGLGHCFFNNDALPETQEAYSVMSRFFGAHLGKRESR